MHKTSNPSILYFGTPVALIGTENENGSYNLAPISSLFWLGYRCVIGIAASSKTVQNLLRTGECVVNLPSEKQVAAVNKLALKTGTYPVPAGKQLKGYVFEPDKFGVSGLTPLAANLVSAPRILECPVNLEARYTSVHPLAVELGAENIRTLIFELKVLRVHTDESIMMTGFPNRIDPDKWRPLMMSFQEFYGLSGKVHPSDLATVNEDLYRTEDAEVAAGKRSPSIF